MSGHLMHRPASAVTAEWIGRTLIVGAGDKTVTGGLSDVVQYRTAHRTVLYLGGRVVDVRSDTTVTADTLGGMVGGVR